MSAVVIREIRDADLAALAALAARSYAAAFGASLPPADLAAHLQATRSEGAFRAALRVDAILVAEEAGALRGYVQLGPVQMPGLAATAADRELRALYVDPSHQGRGIGRQLLEAALDRPELRAAENIYLDVWIENAGARRLYERHGFIAIGERAFETASGVAGDPDVVMVRRRGVVRSL
jgi:ribosomal protein S18 acetylase RimI-like enzyme